jgi:hypothetical protein
MPKKQDKEAGKAISRKINVEIAPGNRTRLEAFIKRYNEHPDRSRPSLTITDVLNEALDDFFTRESIAELREGVPAPIP